MAPIRTSRIGVRLQQRPDLLKIDFPNVMYRVRGIYTGLGNFMNTLWIRKLIGENTYKALRVYYQKLHYYTVVIPDGFIASRQIHKAENGLYLDLNFGAGYGAILNEIVKLLSFENASGLRLRIRVISKFYSRSNMDCALSNYFDAVEGPEFMTFPNRNRRNSVIIRSLIDVPALASMKEYRGTIEDAHRLFFSRYRFKPSLVAEAQSAFRILTENRKNILGIHYRGTDKTSGDRWAEGNPIDAAEFVTHAKAILEHYKDIEGVYVTTDEQAFLDFARREITSHPVYGEDLKRHASHGMGLHIMPGDPAEKAKEAVMIMLMLSECRYMLKTTSLLSAWAKIINPQLIAFVPQMPRVETGGYVFPDKEVYETAIPIPRPF